ncbi:hypothetical protein Tco_0537005 [Tanacetum coccineum]
MKFKRHTVLQTACRTPTVRPRDQEDPHDDAHLEGENSAKRQKTSEYEAYVSGESSSGHVFQEEQAPLTLGNQEQDDDFDFWTNSYATDDDEIPTKQVSQDIMEEVSIFLIKQGKVKLPGSFSFRGKAFPRGFALVFDTAYWLALIRCIEVLSALTEVEIVSSLNLGLTLIEICKFPDNFSCKTMLTA